MMNISLPDAITTVSKMQVFDASPDIFVIIAHDASLSNMVPFFPKGELTRWDGTEDKAVGTWRFSRDFGNAVEILNAKGN
jgi:hypothetical protein